MNYWDEAIKMIKAYSGMTDELLKQEEKDKEVIKMLTEIVKKYEEKTYVLVSDVEAIKKETEEIISINQSLMDIIDRQSVMLGEKKSVCLGVYIGDN